MLIVFGGLPGTGKTTIAREVARCSSATYFRIDVIEMALWAAKIVEDVGPAGYVVAYALSEANLRLGRPSSLTQSTRWRPHAVHGAQ